MPTTNELNDEVRCYTCTGLSQSQALILAFYRRWLLSLNPAADVTLSGLTTYAACYACQGFGLFDILQIAMLDQIAQLT